MANKVMKVTILSAISTASTITGILATTAISNAATLAYTAAYQPTPGDIQFGAPTGYGLTDINNSILSIQKFDSSLGTLNSVILEFTGSMIGDAEFESRDARPQTITVDLSGLLTLAGPDNSTLFELNPQTINPYNVSAYDGKTDFDGTSGKTIKGIPAEKTASSTLTTLSSLAPFIGTGTVDFSFSAQAKSAVKGSGNLVSGISTYAKGGVKVTYDYTAEAPRKIPESSMVLGLGLIAAIGILSQTNNVFNRF